MKVIKISLQVVVVLLIIGFVISPLITYLIMGCFHILLMILEYPLRSLLIGMPTLIGIGYIINSHSNQKLK